MHVGRLSEESLIHDLINLVPSDLLNGPGKVFYSGREAFTVPCPVYLLGINPGGEPNPRVTIQSTIDDVVRVHPAHWSAYQDERWGKSGGYNPLQRRVLYLLTKLNLDPRRTPASNVVFAASRGVSAYPGNIAQDAVRTKRFHECAIAALGVRMILCMGKDASAVVRGWMNASGTPVARFREQNDRGLSTTAHTGKGGMLIVTLTHPGRFDWQSPATDPSPMIREIMSRHSITSPHNP